VLPVEDDASPPPFAKAVPAPAESPRPPRAYYPPPPPPQPVLAMPLPPPNAPFVFPPAVPRPTRSGVVAALGVTAVAGGCIGIFMALAIAIGAFAFLAAADAAGRAVAMAAANQAAAAPPPPPQSQAEEGPNGLPPRQRAEIIDALKYLEFISPNRQEQLDVMLAKAGAQIFPPEQTERTRQSIMSAVTDHGPLYSADPNQPGPIYFVTSAGRLEVHDERAVFQPRDRSIGTVRTFAGGQPGTNGLSIVQVGEVISQAQVASGNALNPAQQQTLRVLLLQAQQDLVPQHRAKAAVKSALVTPAGIRLQFTNGGTVVLGPVGQVVPTGQVDPPRISRGAFATIELLSFVQLGLAIVLLVGASMALRKSARAPGVLKIYAWAKVGVTVALWATVWWMIDDFVGRAVATSGGANVATLPRVVSGATAVQKWLVLFALAGCVIPAGLVLSMKMRAVRENLDGPRPADM
jgi:hypothetical protein